MPERTCAVCRKKSDKEHLFKWVNLNGVISLDWLGKLDARSMYTCRNRVCIERLYEVRKMPEKFFSGKPAFDMERDEQIINIRKLAEKSLLHFISLSRKSGVLVRGQNTVLESLKKDAVEFDFVILAEDISENAVSKIERACNEIDCTVIRFSNKTAIGNMLNGRPLGVLAFKMSGLGARIKNYMEIISNFNQEL